jgi:hypothetical protein
MRTVPISKIGLFKVEVGFLYQITVLSNIDNCFFRDRLIIKKNLHLQIYITSFCHSIFDHTNNRFLGLLLAKRLYLTIQVNPL